MAPILTRVGQSFGFGASTAGAGGPVALEASGGIISDYTTPTGKNYKTHIFTQDGTFEVTSGSASGEYVVIAGGGGGGSGYYGGCLLYTSPSPRDS